MCERKLSQLDIDVRTSGIASAQQDPKRLEETRSLLGEAAWAEELGKMMGRNMPRLFQSHFNGEIARTSFYGTSAYLYELAERPDLND